MLEKTIFALDIGTRSVVGVVLQEGEQGLEIIAYDQLEHPTRSMIDGQIHDVEQVAKTLGIVKERLENKLGCSLKSVAVAAAGRALKTVRVKAEAEIAEYTEVNREDILRLELQAVQEAQKILADNECTEEEKLLNYHCVGYSVVCYDLDGYKIGNLFGQRGKTMTTEIIATFLPRVVVDSLFSALNKIGLELMSLTLEPIAASTVVVPDGMRQLNVALVDIGAGTSDIAITAEGSVVGYGMAPTAGDEITERISSYFLVDFNQAEIIKRAISDQSEIEFVDILGVNHKATREELLEVIEEAVANLTKQISEKIIELNTKTPQAIICIGGGSLTPLLKPLLAENLGLPEQRIAIRGREAITNITGAQELVGPDSVTPIGIAVAAYEKKGLGFARVKVNGRQIRIFDVNHCTIADALMSAGIDLRKTRPRLGLAMTLKVNGELRIIKGEKGKSAVIKLNGENVPIDSSLHDDDTIEFIEAVDGQDAFGYLYDVVPNITPLKVTIEGEYYAINPVIRMNEHLVSYNDKLVDSANIIYYLPNKLGQLLEIVGVNQNETQIFYINGQMASFESILSDNDEITVDSPENMARSEVAPSEMNKATEAPFEVPTDDKSIGVKVNGEHILVHNNKPILTDVLTKANVPLKPPKPGMSFVMKINDKPAEFTSPLNHNDEITLNWAEST